MRRRPAELAIKANITDRSRDVRFTLSKSGRSLTLVDAPLSVRRGRLPVQQEPTKPSHRPAALPGAPYE